ncbi:MAG: hypothetical protein GX095_02445 [Clostridiales bacterium]|nr:hypothetical protein [Clostridiales bacterium]
MKKKFIVVLSIIAIIAVSAAVMAACTDKEEEVRVEKIEIVLAENTVIKVGDKYDSSKFEINATLTDGSKVKVTNTSGIYYDKSGLNLVNGKYSQSGEVTLKIIYLEKYEAELKFTVITA